MKPSLTENESLQSLLIGLGQSGFSYDATYEAKGRRGVEQAFTVSVTGYYEASIDEVTVDTDTTSFTALTAEPHARNPSLPRLDDAANNPRDALHLDHITPYALKRWQDDVSLAPDSLSSYYEDLREQRIQEIIEPDLHRQLDAAADDIERMKSQQNQTNNIIYASVDLQACREKTRAESLQVSPWETNRTPTFPQDMYTDAVHGRAATWTVWNAMTVEAARMRADTSYLERNGFQDVAAQSRSLHTTFNELQNRVKELHEYIGLAESLLANDQPRRTAKRGRRIGDRIEKEGKKRLQNHV